MAISYSLAWTEPVAAEDLVSELVGLGTTSGLMPPDTSGDTVLGDGVLLRGGMWCRAGAAGPRDVPWPDQLEADVGIVESCWAVFREDGDRDRHAQDDEMVWLCSGLLARLPGDAALHFEHEVLWLVRRGGRLVVSDRDDIWTAERLAMLPPPYERAHLVFSDVPDG